MPKVKVAKSKSLAKRLESQGVKFPKHRDKPLWDGPENSGPNGGVTQSLLSRAVACSERFRLKVIEGLYPVDSFSHRMEYGSQWHCCEEAHAKGVDWNKALREYTAKLGQRYRTSGEEITHWYNVCKTQFPIYVDHWSKHPDILKRTPLLQEQVFHVPYVLPSGRTVYLRGKWDSVDLVEDKKTKSIWIQENKAKGDIVEQQIVRQLTFDLQTMMYLIALERCIALDRMAAVQVKCDNVPIAGVRYNVIRRPLAGGKHTIRQHESTQGSKCPKCKGTGNFDGGLSRPEIEECPKCGGVGRINAKPGESKEEFYARLGELIKGEPEYFFMRWNVRITEADVERFKREFLNPFLENLCDDYEWWTFCKEKGVDPFSPRLDQPVGVNRHWRLPYGIYNPVAEGTIGEYDEYLATGSTLGLTTETELFRELK